MSLHLVLFEDRHWRDLRPLTDVLPVPALAFGASTLGERLIAATKLPLLSIEGRHEIMAAWDRAPKESRRADDGDEVIAVNAAALPGAWLAEAIARPGPALLTSDGRVAGARLPFKTSAPSYGHGEKLEAWLRGSGLPERPCECSFVEWPWNLIEWNAKAIAADLSAMPAALAGTVHSSAVLIEPSKIAIAAGAEIEPLVVLDARGGPIRIGAKAVIKAGTVVIGPCVIGEGTQLLGGVVGRSTIGPECRIAGEVEESVWQGYANKRHHGFVGHSLIAEWVNLGALTTTSDLKNNYGNVRVWVDGREVDSKTPKVGSIIGAHVKTGIGTLLPTGASIGVGANLFGGGKFAPKHVPAFGWWDGEKMEEHRLDEFLKTAHVAMARRTKTLSPETEKVLRGLVSEILP